MTSARRPRRVYEVGQDPDPRFTLANERTALAWVRTGLAMVAGGLVGGGEGESTAMGERSGWEVGWA